MNGYTCRGLAITVQHFSDRKKPCLCIYDAGKNVINPVATFRDENASKLFLKKFAEFLGEKGDIFDETI